jgi:dephospho-CoA kinase
MKVIGVTGGIGSGKSVVCRIFSHLGIPVYEADAEAKILYDKYPELKDQVKEKISSEALDRSGNINRKKLAEIVFHDPEKLQILNQIVHPIVAWDFKHWVDSHKGYPYLIKEAAILFESGADKACDQIITVVSPLELRIQRLRERDKKTKNEIEEIISRQINDTERVSRSTYTIYNDEKQMLIPQVLKIHEAILKGPGSSLPKQA